MAIYMLKAKILSRKQNHSAVFKAAYHAGEKLEDLRTGKTADYRNKRQPLHKEILAPPQTPRWLIENRQTLWNAVEATEKRCDAQLARIIEIALPCELNINQNIELVRKYVQEHFVNLGMIADFIISKPPKTYKGKPRNSDPRHIYAQILLTTRTITENGFGQKNRDWNSKNLLESWRVAWEKEVNQALEKAGSNETIDHRSLKARGIVTPADLNHSETSQKVQKSWQKRYAYISVKKEQEQLMKAYQIWLKSLESKNKDTLQEFSQKLQDILKSKPRKNTVAYKQWKATIQKMQQHFIQDFHQNDE